MGENAQGTDVYGPITMDQTWDLAGSPYIVIGDIWVEDSVTLTVEPGVQIKFNGYYSIYVNGTFMAVGTEINRIIITSNMAMPLISDWNRILINSTGHSKIKYCDINYGCFGIYLESSSNISITDNNISNNGIGIYLDSSSNNIITNNDISNNIGVPMMMVDGFGIYLTSSSNNQITDNNITYNGDLMMIIGYGVYFSTSSNNNVKGNNISNNAGGLYQSYSNKNNITNNLLYSNQGSGICLYYSIENFVTANSMSEAGIQISGNLLEHWNTHDIDTSNTVNGKPIYYWKNQTADTIPLGAGQVILANCTNIAIENQEISNCYNGILFGFSSNNNITANSISNDYLGICFYYSSENTVTSNTVTSNNKGIYLYSSIRDNIIDNIVSSNARGISCDLSSPTIAYNNISSNTFDGIELVGSPATISNNYLSYNEIGIFIQESSPYIANNTIVNNWAGMDFNSPTAGITINNTIEDNTARGVMTSGSANPVIINSTVKNNGYDFRALGSFPTALNTTFDDANIDISSSSTLTVKNYLHIWVLDASIAPITGADIEVTDNGIPIYQSPGFGGTDPQTGSNGFVHWIVVTDRIYYGSNTPTENSTIVDVSYPPKTFVNDPRGVNMYSSHIEVFIEVGGVPLPDLALTANDITFKPSSPVIDKTFVTINATVHNNGLIEAYNVVVRFYDGPPPTNFLGEDQIPIILGFGGIGWAEVGWTATPMGAHNISVVVDPENKIAEINEMNNIANKIIDVGVPLVEGWNLISIPYIQSDTNLGNVLSSINGSYDAVQSYYISDNSDPWKHYKVGKPFGNDLFKLNETMGFWIHITQPGDTIFLYNGIQPMVNQTIILHPGWNLVGYPSLTSYNRTEGLNNLTFGTHVDSIWSYNATTQKWEDLGPSDYFEIGRGYWVHAKTKCEWEVPL